MKQDLTKQILLDMIDYYRSRIKKLSDYEKTFVQTISSLNKPCQIYMISSPDQTYHLLLITHFRELEDKLIRNMKLHPDSLASQLKELTEDSMWANLEKEHDSVYSIVQYLCPNEMGNEVARFGRNIVHAVYGKNMPDHSMLGTQAILAEKMVAWELVGRMVEWNYREQIDQFISEYRQQSARRKDENVKNNNPKQLPVAKAYTLKEIPYSVPGFGTYFYPSILIDDPGLTLEDQIFQRGYIKLAKNILVTTIGDMEVAVSSGGLLGIQTNNSETAERVLNLIMAVALLFGLPAYFVRKSEIANIRFEKSTHEMKGSSWSVSGIRMQLFGSLASFGMNYQEVRREQILLNDLHAIINKCKKVWKEEESQKSLELLLNGYTLLDEDTYLQSFITSWTIIERHLHDLRSGNMENTNTGKKIRKDMNPQSLSSMLKVMRADNLITKDYYRDLDGLRRLRNDAIHQGYKITKEQATKCYEMARVLVRNETGTADIIKPIRTVYC